MRRGCTLCRCTKRRIAPHKPYARRNWFKTNPPITRVGVAGREGAQRLQPIRIMSRAQHSIMPSTRRNPYHTLSATSVLKKYSTCQRRYKTVAIPTSPALNPSWHSDSAPGVPPRRGSSGHHRSVNASQLGNKCMKHDVICAERASRRFTKDRCVNEKTGV